MILILTALIAAQAAPVFAKNGAVGLVPPPAMREAASFAGFEDAATQASITIAELPPQAFPEIARRLDAGGTLPNGITLAGAPEALTLADGTPARLYRGSQPANGVTYAKWLLVANGKAATALVTGAVPEAQAEAVRPGIETALKSTVMRAPVTLDQQIAALPFTIRDRVGFRPVRTLMGSSLVLTDGPRDVDPAATQPLAIVAASLGDVPATDREGTARKMLESFGDLTDIVIASDPPTADNRSYRLTATATDRGKPVTVIQHVRFTAPGGYLRTVCVAPKAIPIAARCDRLAATVAPREE